MCRYFFLLSHSLCLSFSFLVYLFYHIFESFFIFMSVTMSVLLVIRSLLLCVDISLFSFCSFGMDLESLTSSLKAVELIFFLFSFLMNR